MTCYPDIYYLIAGYPDNLTRTAQAIDDPEPLVIQEGNMSNLRIIPARLRLSATPETSKLDW